MSLPNPTLDPFPILDNEGKAVAWRTQLLVPLQALARTIVEEHGRLSAGSEARVCACWYQAPGTAAEDALGVDLVEQFIRHPYLSGTYYLRVSAGTDGPQFFRCSPETLDNNTRVAVANIDARRIEALNLELEDGRKREKELREDNDRLRRERNEIEDKRAATARDLAATQAALEAAEEDRAPLLDEEGMLGVLGALKLWADGGEEGRAQALLGRFFVRTLAVTSAIAQDPDVMRIVVTRHGEVWDPYVASFNEAATTLCQGKTEIPQLRSVADVEQALRMLRAAARAESKALPVRSKRSGAKRRASGARA